MKRKERNPIHTAATMIHQSVFFMTHDRALVSLASLTSVGSTAAAEFPGVVRC
jgi:hypothetical protein